MSNKDKKYDIDDLLKRALGTDAAEKPDLSEMIQKTEKDNSSETSWVNSTMIKPTAKKSVFPVSDGH